MSKIYHGSLDEVKNPEIQLKTYKLVDQYLFHTEESLRAIKFIESKIIKL